MAEKRKKEADEEERKRREAEQALKKEELEFHQAVVDEKRKAAEREAERLAAWEKRIKVWAVPLIFGPEEEKTCFFSRQ